MKQEVKVFDFDLAVREQYEAVVAGATMQMSGWEDEEPAAIRRILRSPERANRFLESLERVNRFVEEELLRYPPTKATHQLLNQMAKYYSCCTVFCAIWLSRNALKVYLHDQKRLPGTPETTAEDILSATEDPQGLLSSLYSLYHVLYNCPRDELIADYRSVVEEFLEDYLDICLAVADDPEVRKLRDFLRDFFAYEYQPVMTRPTSWAEYNELPEMKFPELAARWKEAVLSYAISFAKRHDAQKLADGVHQMMEKEVEGFFTFLRRRLWGFFKFKGIRKLTQREVADIFGVSESVVYDWEHNRSLPPASYDGKHIYTKALRIKGDLDAIRLIAEEYDRQRDYKDVYSTKSRVSFDERYHR